MTTPDTPPIDPGTVEELRALLAAEATSLRFNAKQREQTALGTQEPGRADMHLQLAEQYRAKADQFDLAASALDRAPADVGVRAEGQPVPHGYTAETWAAKQSETAEFSRRDPFRDESGERAPNSEARLRAAYVIQCADVPDQFALVRRGDLGTVLNNLTRHRAGHEMGIKARAALPAAPAPETPHDR